MNKKIPKDTDSREIEPWDDFNEVDLSKKRYASDEHRHKMSEISKENWKDPEFRKKVSEGHKRRPKVSGQALENMRRGQRKKSDRSKVTFFEQAKQVHGGKYDYSKFLYVGAHTKGIIICPEHGEFLQTPNQHKRGGGCFRCAVDARAKLKFEKNKKSIFERFIKVHGDKYDYSKVDYQGITKKVIIICPEHGEFLQTPNGHGNQGYGCPKCAEISRRPKIGVALKGRVAPNKLSWDQVLRSFKDAHGDRYDYSKVEYVNTKTKVTIICSKHGEFPQTPSAHKRGAGCIRCGSEQRWKVLKEKKGKSG